MGRALIALGSNLGDRRAALDAAVAAVVDHPSIQRFRVSRFFESFPAGGPAGQGLFLNGAALLETNLPPDRLLAELLAVEDQLGRKREHPWGARMIDLDLVLYGDIVIDTPTLTLPHPRMSFRRFVLEPAVEIAPTMQHPTIGWTIAELLDHLNRADHYIAVSGPPGSGVKRLVASLHQRLGCPCMTDPIDATQYDLLSQVIAGASGSGRDAAVELIQRMCRLVTRNRGIRDQRMQEPPHGQRTPVDWGLPPFVSDFWLDEAIVFIQTLFSLHKADKERPAVDDSFRTSVMDVLYPKLIVLLDAPNDVLWRNVVESQSAWANLLDRRAFFRLCQNLRAHAAQPGHGPILRLKHVASKAMFDEVSAAIDAMQPVTRLDGR